MYRASSSRTGGRHALGRDLVTAGRGAGPAVAAPDSAWPDGATGAPGGIGDPGDPGPLASRPGRTRDLLLNPERVPRSDWRSCYAIHVAAGRYDLIALFYAAPRSGPVLSAATAPGSLCRAVLLRVAQPEDLDSCRATRGNAHANAPPRPVIPPR